MRRFWMMLLCLTVFGWLSATPPQGALAKVKKMSKAQLEQLFDTNLTDMETTVPLMLSKQATHQLFNAEETNKVLSYKLLLLDWMAAMPSPKPDFAKRFEKSAYQLGLLFVAREMPDDAYEVFYFLANPAPTGAQTAPVNGTPYRLRAQAMLKKLERDHGKAYFEAIYGDLATAASPATAAPAAK